MIRKLGKLPARPDAVKFKYGAIFNVAKLPTPPLRFGHFNSISQWGEFGNDKYSDCVFAGAAHETMIWCSEVGAVTTFDDTAVLSDYSAVTNFDPNNPATDQGTDMQEAASYRRKVGLLDASGSRHKVDAYVAIKAGDLVQLAQAAYLFGAVGAGFRMPASAEAQFDAGQPWDVVQGDAVEGGHYVPIIGRNSAGNFLGITWGRLHAMTPRWVSTYMDEGIAYLSIEALKNNLSPEGVSLDDLQRSLQQLAA